MGFYGNITNTSQTQFSFDRTYTSRTEMDGSANNDGVFVGRYVLIEYDTEYSSEDYKQAYRSNDETENVILYLDYTLEKPVQYTENAMYGGELLQGVNIGTMVYVQVDDYYDYYICSGKDESGSALFNKVTSMSGTTPGSISNYVYNYSRDMAYAKVQGYEIGRGWDSTVWQKTYSNGIGKYVMIAELNSVVPTFDISADAPSEYPIAPHFDELSTDVYYKLHMQPTWGFRLASSQPTSGPVINQQGQFDDTMQTQYSGYKSYLSDVSVARSYTLYDTLANQKTTYYYDDDLQNWSDNPYKYVDVTKYLNNGSLKYTANTYYYLNNNDDDNYILDENNYLTFNRTYYRKMDRQIRAAIYFNRDGFDKNAISSISGSDMIQFLDGKSGMLYNSHDSDKSLISDFDTKELAIYLPSLGNTISDVWDIVYGGIGTAYYDKAQGKWYRNQSLDWEDASSALLREGLRLVNKDDSGNGFTYSKDDQVNTIAGCINSVHDLMGMIIVDKTTDDAYTLNAKGLDEEKIYYFDKNKNYFYKKKYYNYTTIPYMYKQIELTENSYIPNTYYIANTTDPDIYSSDDFDIATSSDFSEDTVYYAKYSSDKNQDYYEINLSTYTPGYYKTDSGDYIYDSKESPQENIDYYTFNSSLAKEVTLTGNYEANYYYYWDEDTKTYALDRSSTVTSGRTYYTINPSENELIPVYLEDESSYNELTGLYYIGEDEDGVPLYEPLTYLYAPGIFTNNSIFYSVETDESGNTTKYVPLKDELVENTQYYLVDLVQALDGNSSNWQIDDNGNIILVGSTGDYWTIDNVKKVDLIPWEDNKYYFISDTGYQLLTKELLAEQLPLMVKRTTKVTQDGETTTLVQDPEFVNYYTINPTLEGNFYIPYKYYYQEDKDWILGKTDDLQDGIKYYSFDPEEAFKLIEKTYYVPNKYYYDAEINGETIKLLDRNQTMTSSRTYYKKVDYYVEEDKFNLFPRGSIWNKSIDVIPASVSLASRDEYYGMKKLVGFSRDLNTIHGLILKINQLLEMDDTDTRDKNTVSGSINIMNDIVNKFDILTPNSFIVVDNYGRIRSTNVTTDDYLTVKVDGNVVNTNTSFTHNLSGVTGDKTVTNGTKTISYGGSFDLPVISYNAAGHITEVTKETLTLPKLSLGTSGSGNVLTGISLDNTNGKFTQTKTNVGTLALTGYSIATASAAIAATDSINTAIGKLEYKINDEINARENLDLSDTEDNTKFISSITQTDGKVAFKRAAADTLLVSGTSLSTIKTDVDNLKTTVGNSTSGLVQKVSAIENADYATIKKSDIENWNKAEENVQADWNETNTASDAYIANKPDLTDVVKTSTEFTSGDSTYTIAEMLAYITRLEERIVQLEENNN